MPHHVILPPVGETKRTATLLGWKNREDGVVCVGDVIAEIEADKANADLFAEVDGQLVWQVYSPGCTVSVGETIAVIALPDEDAAAVQHEAKRRFPLHAPPPKRAILSRLFGLRS